MLPSHLEVALGEPAAGLDKLDDVDGLLDGHDWEADASDDPGHERVHLVGAGHLEGGGAVGVGEELADDGRVGLGAGLDLGAGGGLEQLGREVRGGEGEEVEADEEELVEGAADEEERLEKRSQHESRLELVCDGCVGAYLVRVVEVEDPAAALVDALVAARGTTHGERRIHVDVVAGEVEREQALEDDGPSREGAGEEDEEAGCRAAVGHHIKHRAEAGGLLE